MGWPKGKPRGNGLWAASNRPAIANPFASALKDWTRSDHLRACEAALCEYVERGEHIEADKHHPGARAKAEQAYSKLIARDGKLKAGVQRANQRKTLCVEARRQWISLHCKDFAFLRSRKLAISHIQSMIGVAGYPVPSAKRLYADIAAIRKGWGKGYLSRAKDKQ